ATLIETRIGFRPAGETMNPILGRVPGFANLTLGNGLGAGGLTIGPFAGSQIARIAAGQATDIPLDLYAPKAS
ncbi:MAG: FAD-dependent oxidoreductase, partial [Oxalobacteraceae bacterium]